MVGINLKNLSSNKDLTWRTLACWWTWASTYSTASIPKSVHPFMKLTTFSDFLTTSRSKLSRKPNSLGTISTMCTSATKAWKIRSPVFSKAWPGKLRHSTTYVLSTKVLSAESTCFKWSKILWNNLVFSTAVCGVRCREFPKSQKLRIRKRSRKRGFWDRFGLKLKAKTSQKKSLMMRKTPLRPTLQNNFFTQLKKPGCLNPWHVCTVDRLTHSKRLKRGTTHLNRNATSKFN